MLFGVGVFFDDAIKLVPVDQVMLFGGVSDCHFEAVSVVLIVGELVKVVDDCGDLKVVPVAVKILLVDGVLFFEGKVVE